jgi:hypothetical protein
MIYQDHKRQYEDLRRKFQYRCGFCGVAETLLNLSGSGGWQLETTLPSPQDRISNFPQGEPVYACRRCIYAISCLPRRPKRLRIEHRGEKTYYRHLHFEPSGIIASLTPHGEDLVISANLNDPIKVRTRLYEYQVRERNKNVLLEFPPLISRLLDMAATKADPSLIDIAKEAHRLLLMASSDLKQLPEPIDSVYPEEELASFDCVSAEEYLTPYLIDHLKINPDDLSKIKPSVFEDLVAEFFAGQGFKVNLVGRDARTGADVLALKKLDPFEIEIRHLIEVKRWRRKVGIEEIRKVAGALALEKHKHGWHLALLVSVAGFKNLRGTTRRKLSLLGIELRDKQSLLEELRTYKPRTDGGLWLNYGWEDCLSGVQIK